MTEAPIPNSDALEAGLARALTEAVAPQETPFFDDILAMTRKPRAKGKDHTLGFGVSAGDVAAITLVLIDLAKPILRFIWANAKDATGALIKDASQSAKMIIEQKMSVWLDHKLNGRAPISLPSGKLDELIATVEQQAVSLKLDAGALVRLSETLRSAFTQQ
jgi:hypothetical protein